VKALKIIGACAAVLIVGSTFMVYAIGSAANYNRA
jgi:hypothetical protein